MKKPELKFCDPDDNVITCKVPDEFCKKLDYPICKKIKSERMPLVTVMSFLGSSALLHFGDTSNMELSTSRENC